MQKGNCDMKKGIIFAIIAVVGIVLMITRETYDPSIHEEHLQSFASKSRFQDLMMVDSENEFGAGYDIRIWKSDEKSELPHNVSSKEYYKYDVVIYINDKFNEFYRSNQWEVLEDMTAQFEHIKVGIGTNFEGYYDNVRLYYHNYEDLDRDYRMNVFGFPKKVNGKEYKEFMLAYYDEDNNPVYFK